MTLIPGEADPVFEGHLPPTESAPVNHIISPGHHTEITFLLHDGFPGCCSPSLARGVDYKVFSLVCIYVVLCISIF